MEVEYSYSPRTFWEYQGLWVIARPSRDALDLIELGDRARRYVETVR